MNKGFPLLDAALDDATGWVRRCAEADLGVASPCGDWDLAALLRHMIGQNHGFALAVASGDAPESAYLGPTVSNRTVEPLWEASVQALRGAFAAAAADAPVRLIELDLTVSAERALQMQVLDTAVHAWDVATSLGLSYAPRAETIELVLAFARQIADRPASASFAEPLDLAGDPWRDALRLLGRPA